MDFIQFGGSAELFHPNPLIVFIFGGFPVYEVGRKTHHGELVTLWIIGVVLEVEGGSYQKVAVVFSGTLEHAPATDVGSEAIHGADLFHGKLPGVYDAGIGNKLYLHREGLYIGICSYIQ